MCNFYLVLRIFIPEFDTSQLFVVEMTKFGDMSVKHVRHFSLMLQSFLEHCHLRYSFEVLNSSHGLSRSMFQIAL